MDIGVKGHELATFGGLRTRGGSRAANSRRFAGREVSGCEGQGSRTAGLVKGMPARAMQDTGQKGHWSKGRLVKRDTGQKGYVKGILVKRDTGQKGYWSKVMLVKRSHVSRRTGQARAVYADEAPLDKGGGGGVGAGRAAQGEGVCGGEWGGLAWLAGSDVAARRVTVTVTRQPAAPAGSGAAVEGGSRAR